MKSRDVIQMLLEDGWVQVRVKGSHVQFNPSPPTKRGTVTVPHPKKDLPLGTFNSIRKQAQLDE